MTSHEASDPRRPPHLDTLSGMIEIELAEFVLPPEEPGGLLARWVDIAIASRVIEPFSMSLATANAQGRPSNRTVLVKKVTASAVEFVTTATSAKGRDLEENPWAAIVAYWRETRQQLRFSGPVERLSDAEADEVFSLRPIAAQASAIASHQSEPLEDYAELRARADRLAQSPAPLPRPPAWNCYRLVPETIEFWHGSVDRLHRRLVYARTPEGWQHRLLNP
ncbi:pyridoxal 5'-phosphate synthase [Homoserinimonas hongtaonis]|uniref:Pyridoxamine 5'-phosphate oxidase n=1 Tax=Homoserinimonas hongtaonis TaxID=2079791 RepID=A0A2U1T0B4_9MICO|nr:pyridoxal 5'-phosphate synthase [Salinibacterium hongtaonis]PWB97296.1 pyridoxamine 5'-phosphate oxidase [Salinibacterium hongtaonis]